MEHGDTQLVDASPDEFGEIQSSATGHDTAPGLTGNSPVDDRLALARQRATIRREEAEREHRDALDALNVLAKAIDAKERSLEKLRSSLVELKRQHMAQQVLTETAREELAGALRAEHKVHKDSVRGRPPIHEQARQ